MRISAVTREQFSVWRRLRQAVYSELEPQLHDEEMNCLFCSDQAACFLAWSEPGDAIGLLEITLRNFVDGCIGSPVGYLEGIYLDPDHRGAGHGSRLVGYQGSGASSTRRTHGPVDTQANTQHGDRIVYCNETDGHAWKFLTVSYARKPRNGTQADA